MTLAEAETEFADASAAFSRATMEGTEEQSRRAWLRRVSAELKLDAQITIARRMEREQRKGATP